MTEIRTPPAAGVRPVQGLTTQGRSPVPEQPSRPQQRALPQRDGVLVEAAGVLCWRPARHGGLHKAGGIEVLLVHRPRDGDWSWPKGKPHTGEAAPVCAAREAQEETGVRVRLGRPLPEVRYQLPDGRIKRVRYWAAEPRAARQRAKDREVDETSWVPVDRARTLLTYPGDRAVLEDLVTLAARGELATTPALVVRHATARPRNDWTRADGERPLVGSGRRQALALAPLLECWHPEHAMSSPWRRCRQTLAPYLQTRSLRLRTKGGLTEDGHRRSPRKAGRHAKRLLNRGRAALLCTHRPVLPAVLAVLRAAATATAGTAIPDSDPYLAPGEVLVAHVARGRGEPRVLAVERHIPAH